MTSYLTLLLATLGIMIGLFTVTGFINRMGAMLLDLGSWNIIAMVVMAWVFGWLVGAGLPPTATYIIGAVVIVRPLRELGINPWVAHFFVFLLSVWGELSPPTSLTAAVSARIAEASFMRTMYEALKICMPITLMTFAIFTRYDMVVNPGWPQIVATVLVLISVCGVTFAMFGRYVTNAASDILLRSMLALFSLVCDAASGRPLVDGDRRVRLARYPDRHLAPPTYRQPQDGRRGTADRRRARANPGRDSQSSFRRMMADGPQGAWAKGAGSEDRSQARHSHGAGDLQAPLLLLVVETREQRPRDIA